MHVVALNAKDLTAISERKERFRKVLKDGTCTVLRLIGSEEYALMTDSAKQRRMRPFTHHLGLAGLATVEIGHLLMTYDRLEGFGTISLFKTCHGSLEDARFPPWRDPRGLDGG